MSSMNMSLNDQLSLQKAVRSGLVMNFGLKHAQVWWVEAPL